MPDQITIVIADDHELVRQGIRTFLEAHADFCVVGEAASGEEAVCLVTDHTPTVVLLDLVMPGVGGIEATRLIKHVSPQTHVIVLTSYHNDEYIFPALRAGALSFILKDISTAELAEAVRKAARGESMLHSRVASRVVREIRGTLAQEEIPNLFTELSERELDVLRLIADGLSNAAIAERLVISERTVKVHVSNILSKLHIADRTQAAVYAWQQGLVRRSVK